jgi:hypothetical protein
MDVKQGTRQLLSDVNLLILMIYYYYHFNFLFIFFLSLALRADKQRPFPTLLVAGIERYPLKVTRKMGRRKVARRSQVKPFLKIVNVAHVMPTRYILIVFLLIYYFLYFFILFILVVIQWMLILNRFLMPQKPMEMSQSDLKPSHQFEKFSKSVTQQEKIVGFSKN